MALPTPLLLEPSSAPRQGLGTMAASLDGSEILRIAAEVRAMKQRGESPCDLTVGDFSPQQFRIPAELEAGIVAALAAGETHYPPGDGLLELRQAIAGFYAEALGLDYPLPAVLVAGGARPLIWAAFRAILDRGERVVYPVPSWNNNHYCHLCEARGNAVPTRPENGFLPTAEELAPHLGEARLVSLSSPLNPAGTGFARQRLAAIARLVVAENERRGQGAPPLFLLYDQIYWLLADDAAPHATPVELVPEVAPYTVFVDGVSKAFAATGLRVGWAVGPPFLIARMRDLLGHVGAWAPRPEQVATARLLASPERARRAAAGVRGALARRLTALHAGLRELGARGLPVEVLPPAGALYLAARFDLVRALGSNEAIRRRLLTAAGFAVVPFQAFGLAEDSGWFRLSVGAVSLEDIAAALPRVEAVLESVLQETT